MRVKEWEEAGWCVPEEDAGGFAQSVGPKATQLDAAGESQDVLPPANPPPATQYVTRFEQTDPGEQQDVTPPAVHEHSAEAGTEAHAHLARTATA